MVASVGGRVPARPLPPPPPPDWELEDDEMYSAAGIAETVELRLETDAVVEAMAEKRE